MTYVHTGLDPSRPAEAQIEALKGRNPFAPILLKEGDPSRIQAFCERSKVRHMHPQLTGQALLVSGHHGMTQIGAFLSRPCPCLCLCLGRWSLWLSLAVACLCLWLLASHSLVFARPSRLTHTDMDGLCVTLLCRGRSGHSRHEWRQSIAATSNPGQVLCQ